jgi:pimeloyl-ACP methyl ester carboxylesterase
MRFVRLLPVTLLLAAATTAAAPTTTNVAREQNWANEIVDMLMVGEAVWLTARDHKFLALHTAPAGGGKRAVILAHGKGVHPAFGLIDKLRGDLAEAGFHTLSLQMPILENEASSAAYGATFPEAFERIDAGIRYLKEKHGIGDVVLLGHSIGAITVVAYVARHPQAPVRAVVAVSGGHIADGPETMQPAKMLKDVRQPVLDIYGGADLPEVLTQAPARAAAAKAAGNRGYQVVRVPDADHFFTDHYAPLRQQTADWLKRQ